MASTDARPVPIKNTAYRAYFGIFKNDGTLITGATGLDSEVSKDGATFADCTNEATEISQGLYYLDLSSTEMNADSVLVVVKSTSTGAVPVVLSLYPEETGDINVDVTAFGGTAGTFASGRPEVNTSHFGGTAGTFASGRPEVNTSHIAGSAVSTSSAQIGVNVVNAGGTAWGSGAITAGSIASDAITAAKIATGAIDADAIASDAVTELTTGVLTTQMTEAYAADGVAPTLAQAVFAIQQFLQEKAISGTTLTVKKLDGTTTAMTFTLNDATTPTSVTRAS